MQQTHRYHLRKAVRTALFVMAVGGPSVIQIPFAQAADTAKPALVTFHIKAGPLQESLSEFASVAGISISLPPVLVDGKVSGELNGSYTTQQGLDSLLTGSGLQAVETGKGVFTLQKANPVNKGQSDVEMLKEVSVTAASDRDTEIATGPVKGYVAKRSATATKTDTPIIETPQSISVITRDQMTAQGVQSVSDALRYTAGVLAESNGPDPRADNIVIRGFDANGRDQYRDGLRSYAFNNQGGTVMEPYGLERVEVLRGPSSILYGQGGPGGLVNLVSKRPTDKPVHELLAQLGSFDRKQVAGDFGGLLTDDGVWSYRLTGLWRESDAQIDYVRDDRVFIAPAITWRPSDATSLTILTDYQKNKRGQGYQAWPRMGTLDSNPNGRFSTSRFVGEPSVDKFNQERYAMGYLFEHVFNEHMLFRQNVRYQNMKTNAVSVYMSGLLADNRTVGRFGGGSNEETDNVTLDNHMQFKWESGIFAHTGLIGLDSQRMRSHVVGTFGVFSDLDLYNPVYGVAIPTLAVDSDVSKRLRQNGAYIQDQIKIDQKWVLTLGGRHDWARTSSNDHLAPENSNAQNDSATTWRAGLVYLTDNGWAPYASYTESFTPVIGSTSPARGSKPFAPETGKQYEIGLRFQPEGQRTMLTFALFDLTRQNLTTADLQDATGSYNIQRGEVRARGFEAEAKTQLDNGLDLIASFTHTVMDITKSNDGVQGNTPNNVPKHAAALWANYQLPASWLAGLNVGAGVRYIGARYGEDDNAYKLPAYTLVDASVRYDLSLLGEQWKGWQFAMNASNLFDKEYVATCGYYGDACKWGYRRNVLGTLTYRW
jgi:iron complex outermembrane recepter protein